MKTINSKNRVPKYLIWSAASAALAWLGWSALREPVQMVSVTAVTRGALEQSFLEEGKTRLKQRYVISAPVAGRLRRIALQPGDALQANQVVAEIEPLSSSLLDPRARSQARTEVAASTSALQAAQQRLAAAQTANAVAQKELQRLSALADSGMLSPAALDQGRLHAASASAALSSAQADAQVAQQRLQGAQALQADEGQAGGGKLVQVRAPVAGVLTRRAVESATPVALGQVLLEMGNPQLLEIEVEVLSGDAVRLRTGQSARVLRWGGKGVLTANITRIEPAAFTRISALGVQEQRTRVILDFNSTPEQWATLGDGYRVEVEFILRQDQDLLQIPSNALLRHANGWAVYRVEDGVARHTVLQIGVRSASTVQVLDGLQAGQNVIAPPDDRIKDGSRVRATVPPKTAD